MEKIEIGVITKPQALKGEFRVKLYSNNYSIFNNINYIIFDNVKYEIESFKSRVSFTVLKLKQFNSIMEIKEIVGKKIFVNKSDLKIEDTEILVDELIGYAVVNEKNDVIGKVISVDNFGAGDIYSLEMQSGGNIQFVNARNVIVSMNEVNKIIVVNQSIFNEVSI